MNILITSLQAPYPPYDGGSIRTIEVLKGLSENHQVTFLGTFDPATESPIELKAHLLNYCNRAELVAHSSGRKPWDRAQQLRELFAFPPERITQFLNPEYVRTATRLASEPFDVIICNAILAGQWLNQCATSLPRVLDTFDIFALIGQRECNLRKQFGFTNLCHYIEWKKTAIYERQIWRCFDRLIAISDSDAALLSRTCPHKITTTIPTGVEMPQIRLVDQTEKKFDLLMVGKWDYPPNQDALEYFDKQMMPWIIRDHPSIQVAIVGKGHVESIETIAKRPSNYRIFCNVPDVAPYYHQSKIAVIPMRAGGGIKVKLLEALAYQMPVITTTIGAHGIPVQDGVHVVVADEPMRFANAISQLLSNIQIANALAYRGRRFVCERYDWQAIKAQYLTFIESCVADSHPRHAKYSSAM